MEEEGGDHQAGKAEGKSRGWALPGEGGPNFQSSSAHVPISHAGGESHMCTAKQCDPQKKVCLAPDCPGALLGIQPLPAGRKRALPAGAEAGDLGWGQGMCQGTYVRPPAPGVVAGGWVGQRPLMGALQGLLPWTKGTFPCHTEHFMGWKSAWPIYGEELPPTSTASSKGFPALAPFPRTASQPAATVRAGGTLAPRRPSRGLQPQPSPACERRCPQEWVFNLGCLLSNDRCESAPPSRCYTSQQHDEKV